MCVCACACVYMCVRACARVRVCVRYYDLFSLLFLFLTFYSVLPPDSVSVLDHCGESRSASKTSYVNTTHTSMLRRARRQKDLTMTKHKRKHYAVFHLRLYFVSALIVEGTSWAGIMEADDSKVTTVFTVQPSFHHRHSTNRVS